MVLKMCKSVRFVNAGKSTLSIEVGLACDYKM